MPKGKGILHFWHRKRGFDRNSSNLPRIVEETCDYILEKGIF